MQIKRGAIFIEKQQTPNTKESPYYSIEDAERVYNQDIASQTQGYEITAKLIGYVIQKMKAEGIISGNVKITGRIKSFRSAYENYKLKGKVIDDCFGIRIIAQGEEDLSKIEQELRNFLTIYREKKHGDPNEKGYNAIHHMAYLSDKYVEGKEISRGLFPVVEIQYWTEDLERMCNTGELAYSRYKDRDISKIKKKYEEDPQSVLKGLPTYYKILGNSVSILSREETLYTMYPELLEEDKTKDVEECDY